MRHCHPITSMTVEAIRFLKTGLTACRGEEWSFSLSDEFNRPVVTGTCHNSYFYEDLQLSEINVKARRDDTGTAFHGYIPECRVVCMFQSDNTNKFDWSFTGNLQQLFDKDTTTRLMPSS